MRLPSRVDRSSILVVVTLVAVLIGVVVYLRATRVMVRAGVWSPRQVRMAIFQPCTTWAPDNPVYSPYRLYRTTDRKGIGTLYRAANDDAFGADPGEAESTRLALVRHDGRVVMFALWVFDYHGEGGRLVFDKKADAATQSAFGHIKPDRTRIPPVRPSRVSLHSIKGGEAIELALDEPGVRDQFNAVLGTILDRFNPYSLGGSWKASSGESKGMSEVLRFMERNARSAAYVEIGLAEPIRFETVIIPWGMRWPPRGPAEVRARLSPIVADTLLIISSEEKHFGLPVVLLGFGLKNQGNWVVSAPLLSDKRPLGEASLAPGVAGDLFSDLESLIRRHPMRGPASTE